MVTFHQSNKNVTGGTGECCWPFIYLFIYLLIYLLYWTIPAWI